MLAATLPPLPAVWIEDKEHTVAVHYRGAPEQVRSVVAESVDRAVYPWRRVLRIVPEVVLVGGFRAAGGYGVAVLRELAGLVAGASCMWATIAPRRLPHLVGFAWRTGPTRARGLEGSGRSRFSRKVEG